jgi:DnaJ-class molecular chaperone
LNINIFKHILLKYIRLIKENIMTCPCCNGTGTIEEILDDEGEYESSETCQECGGTGVVGDDDEE